MKSLVFALLTMFSTNLLADPVVLRIGMSSSGPISELQEFLEGLRQVSNQIQPNANTTATLMTNTFHGPNVGGVSLALTFENLQAWSEYQAMTTNPQWQNATQSFPANFTINYQGLSNVVWRDPNFTPAQAGEVLVINILNVNQGGLNPLIAFMDRARAVSGQLGISGQATLMSPIVAGDATAQNQATVVIKYESAEAWAAATTKQNASSEWAQLMAGFPAQNYSLSFQGMSTIVDLPQ